MAQLSRARRRWIGVGLAAVLTPAALPGQTPTPARPATRQTVVAGDHYQAGWLHRLLLGAHYRDLWATPLEVDVLDLSRFAGGLTPTGCGGRRQTKVLRLLGKDGRQYVFRSVDKDPTLALPPDLRATFAKKLVQDNCTICHNLRNVVLSNKSADDWDNTVDMMKNAGAPITADQAKEIKQYLIASFPEGPRPKPAVIDGPIKVKFDIWNVPTPGSRPHDPLATPDGAIWWSGQFANRLGRLDPKTGEMKEYPIPVLGGPHGLINDKDGNIWYGGNWGGHIGKLDVKTGEYKIYPMPDPKAKDPHTPLFDRDGILWFSVQNGGFMGRLDPVSGGPRR